MKSVRYVVAMSLDGYIAGPKGEFDWIVMDPEFDFDEIYAQFDTMIMGRRTYEAMKGAGGGGTGAGMYVYVASRTLRQADHPGVTVGLESVILWTGRVASLLTLLAATGLVAGIARLATAVVGSPRDVCATERPRS